MARGVFRNRELRDGPPGPVHFLLESDDTASLLTDHAHLDDVLGVVAGKVDVVGDHDDGGSTVDPQLVKQIEGLPGSAAIEVTGRFVDEKQTGLVRERSS